METRASYIAVGAFVLVLILGLVGFVVWIGKFQGADKFARYDILFDGSVTGLQVEGTVRYRASRRSHHSTFGSTPPTSRRSASPSR
jgi:phospholipid/cholesterol/gamma-HCH transport system substrate-binding protein